MNRAAPEKLDKVVIRFAGDSGDGMQLLGTQFTRTAAIHGNDLATLPDYPAEIRAPAGTREGVSGFQLQFASHDIFTPGDEANVLVAMNAAALITNLQAVVGGGLVIVNTDKFGKGDLSKARLDTNPLEDGTLDGYRRVDAPISTLTRAAVAPLGLNSKQADRCKNFFGLGMMYWLYGRDMGLTEGWITTKFKAPYSDANLAAMRAGHAFAETIEVFQTTYEVPPADLAPGKYRNIIGNQALAVGLAAAAVKSGRKLFYGSYPITPASDILHSLAPFKNFGVLTYQAEDEIAAICSSIGASYGGHIGVTGTSGPGLALKGEALGLAMIVELPLVVINVQRGGPSTGLPTKTEQSDLLQCMYGRNGESPLPVIAARSPADAFDVAFEATRIAIKYMTPVVLVSDGYIGTGSEPWKLPNLDTLPDISPNFAPPTDGEEDYQAYTRDPVTLARPWAIPGTAGLEHRVGGLEKQDLTGNVSYDPANHQKMTDLRAAKVQRIQAEIPASEVYGDDQGILVVGWGSTYGSIRTGVVECREQGLNVAHLQLRWINPFPPDLGDILAKYDRVLVPELNMGQLTQLLRAEFLVDARVLGKVQGKPFRTQEIVDGIKALASEEPS
jgi:2-oxoglutarate/2-oxoacid ferredoxin oxidoreductase subunit alpha